MYAADLTALLKLFQEIEANEVLSTAGMGPGEPWHAQLILVKEQVTHCSVYSRVNGRRLLADGEALRWLARLGDLIWKPLVSTRQLPALLPPPAAPVPHQGQEVPRRLDKAEPAGMQSWSRKQRQVFALVDGRRTTQRIAAILCQPPEVVAALLNDLRSLGVIAWSREPFVNKKGDGLSSRVVQGRKEARETWYNSIYFKAVLSRCVGRRRTLQPLSTIGCSRGSLRRSPSSPILI